jgi:ATP-dependent DNA helicase RecQ
MSSRGNSDTDAYGRAKAVLKQYWGYDDFRPGQQDVVAAAVQGRDVLAVLPTGGGKSICYQAPAMLDEGITVVVSPLIALMQDQVDGLRRAGIRAAFMNSTMSARAIDQCWTDLRFGLYRMLYVAPERLTTDDFAVRAETISIARVAVDEAHCISEWGHNFRPSYLRIADALDRLGRPPVLALTATATPRVRDDIKTHLRLKDPATIVSGFDRPNIVWSVFQDENKKRHVERVLTAVPGSGIVYAATRRGTETWAEWLKSTGISASAYHAGLSSEQRSAVQRAWIDGDIRVVTATNAFGMGIDKPDVRFVIHAQIPSSLEAYYQEAGRGGRDGDRAYAVLLFHQADIAVQQRLIDGSHPAPKFIQRVYESVCSMGGIAVGAEAEEPLVVERAGVLRATDATTGQISRAIDVIEQEERWRQISLDPSSGLLRFTTSSDALRGAGQKKGGTFGQFVDAVLRTVDAAAFRSWTVVQPASIGKAAGLPADRVSDGLAFLDARGMCSWRPATDSYVIDLLGPRVSRVRVDARSIERSRRSSQRKLDDMLQFALGVGCRRKHLLAYFGEAFAAPCGRCDVCLRRHETTVVTPADEPALRAILKRLESDAMAASATTDRDAGLLRWLLKEGYISMDAAEPWRLALTERARTHLRRSA